jgi:hypothetical protein
MLLTFHLPQQHNITDAAICSYLHFNHNESEKAPVFLFLSFPFIAQHTPSHTSQNKHSLVVFFLWVIPQHMNFICRHFRTLCLFLLPAYTAYEDGTECSETSANTIQTARNHPKEKIQHSEHGESLISRNTISFPTITPNLYSNMH